MIRNIGKCERMIRVVAGLILVSLAFTGPANPWFLLGAIPLLTGIVGWCPPYALLGINTDKSCGSCAKEKP